MIVTDKYVLFWGDYLGNWTKLPKPISYLDWSYKGNSNNPQGFGLSLDTSEHLFMFIKAMTFKDEEIAEKILFAPTPKEAKRLGRLVKNFDEATWDTKKVSAMFTAVFHRSMVDQKFKDLILKPEWESLEFVEASPYDKIWGIGLAEADPLAKDSSTWKGQNLLGKCLVELRRYIKFLDWVGTLEPYTFNEDLIWCPSQIYYFFEDSGQKYVLYLRWRWSDPWTAEVVKVSEFDYNRGWDFSTSVKILKDKWFKEDDYRELEKESLLVLKDMFPNVNFPDEPVIKNSSIWDGIQLLK